MTAASHANDPGDSHFPSSVAFFFKAIMVALFWFVGTTTPSLALDIFSDAPVKVTLQLKWTHQFQFAGYYMAKKMGYYTDAGLDVDFLEFYPGLNVVEQTLDGHANFGIGTTDLLVNRDKGMPVVVLGSILQHSPYAIMVRNTSGITNIHQLAASPVMVDLHNVELMAMFKREGIDINRLRIVKPTYNILDLMKDEIGGATVYTTNEPFIFDQMGEDYLLLRPISSGIDFYGDTLFTSEHMTQNHPDVVKAFWDASKKGWQYALDHQDETIDHILKKYSTAKEREHLVFEADRTRDLIMPHIVEIGYMTPTRWAAILDIYQDLGLVSDKLDISGFLYNTTPTQLPSWFWDIAVVVTMTLVIGAIAITHQTRTNRLLRQKESQLRDANQHKDMLLSIIGHDLKNPIFAIRNFSKRLENDPKSIPPESLPRYGRLITFGIDTAMGLLDNLQQWAVLQSNTTKIENQPVDLQPIVERNLNLFFLKAESENITMTGKGFENIKVLGNEWRLDTVLRNLISNAYKNTPQGGCISLSVSSNGKTHDIIVEDSGTGICAETFSIFNQPDGKALMNENRTGSGFTLPLCKHLVELQGGELTLENSSEGGLKVTLRLMKA